MGTVAVPASAAEALEMWQASVGYLADVDAASMPAAALAQILRGMEQADAVTTVAWARMLAAYDAKDGHLADGQRSLGAWLVHMLRVTRAQAAQYKAIQALARDHEPLLAGLRSRAVTTSEALQLAKWTRRSRPSTAGRPRRSSSPRRGPAPTCGRWRRSARRSGPGPSRPTRTAAIRRWTGPCSWTPPWTAPGSSAATSPPSAPPWSRPSWMPCPPRPGPGTCGRGRSATTTRSPRR